MRFDSGDSSHQPDSPRTKRIRDSKDDDDGTPYNVGEVPETLPEHRPEKVIVAKERDIELMKPKHQKIARLANPWGPSWVTFFVDPETLRTWLYLGFMFTGYGFMIRPLIQPYPT